MKVAIVGGGIGGMTLALSLLAAGIGEVDIYGGTNKRDPILWAIFAVVLVATVVSQAELAALFLLAGLVAILVRAWPGTSRAVLLGAACALGAAVIGGMESLLLRAYDGAVPYRSNEATSAMGLRGWSRGGRPDGFSGSG